jgi:hypothetical protein
VDRYLKRRKRALRLELVFKVFCFPYGGEEERVLVIGRKSEGKRPLGRTRRRWVDNVKLDLVEIRCYGVDRIGLAQDRDTRKAPVNAVMNLRVL